MYQQENQKIAWKFQHISKPTWFPCVTPDLAQYNLTGPCESLAFLVGWLVLHWGNTHAKMCKCRGLSQQMLEQ